jgi:hypothetical protein
MAGFFLNKNSDENLSMKKIKHVLCDKTACYVLLTCSHPNEEGKMMVEVTYEGDEAVASYLVDNAKEILDQNSKHHNEYC